jgi:hypothetical protein
MRPLLQSPSLRALNSRFKACPILQMRYPTPLMIRFTVALETEAGRVGSTLNMGKSRCIGIREVASPAYSFHTCQHAFWLDGPHQTWNVVPHILGLTKETSLQKGLWLAPVKEALLMAIEDDLFAQRFNGEEKFLGGKMSVVYHLLSSTSIL